MNINTLPAKDKAEVLAVRRKLKRAEVYAENEQLRKENAMLKAQIADLVEAKKQVTSAWLGLLRQSGRI